MSRPRGNGRGWFCKTQARSRIPLMISRSIPKTKQKLLAWRPRQCSRLEKDGVGEASSFPVTLWLVASQLEIQVTAWTCNWHLKYRQSCGPESPTCGFQCYFLVECQNWAELLENFLDVWRKSPHVGIRCRTLISITCQGSVYISAQ